MDVQKEGMMDSMMDDMMGGIMDGHTPESLIRKLVETEKMEAALYARIAKCVPSEQLRKMIMYRAKHEQRQAERIAMLSKYFGVMPVDPGMSMP